MSTPTEYYHSLPPVSKTFGVACLITTAAFHLNFIIFQDMALYYGLVFKQFQVWSREFPNEIINIYDLVYLKSFYLPWATVALNLIFGNFLMADILGMVAGHLYYFLTVLHPLAGGNFNFHTPLWVHKLVAYWGEGYQMNSPVQRNASAGIVFRGRSNRLGRGQSTTARRTS